MEEVDTDGVDDKVFSRFCIISIFCIISEQLT